MTTKWSGPKLQVDEEFSDHSSDDSSGGSSSSSDDEASPTPPKTGVVAKKKKATDKTMLAPSQRRKTPESESDDTEGVKLSPKKHQKKQLTPKPRVSGGTQVLHRKTPRPTAKVPIMTTKKNSTIPQSRPMTQKDMSRLKDKNPIIANKGSTSTSEDERRGKIAASATKKKKKTKKNKIVSPPSPSLSSGSNNDDDGPCAAPRCSLPDERNVHWVQCDGCQGWFHYKCVGLLPQDILEDEEYYCFHCQASISSKTKN